MINEFVERFNERKNELRKKFEEKHPEDYKEVITNVITILSNKETYSPFNPDPSRIHEINDGDYQGTLLYVIPEQGYQPRTYFYVMVDYGSCSGCDTLQRICDYSFGEKPILQQVDDYMTLALHIVQSLKIMKED